MYQSACNYNKKPRLTRKWNKWMRYRNKNKKYKWDLECNERYQTHKNYISRVHSWHLLLIAHSCDRVSTISPLSLYISLLRPYYSDIHSLQWPFSGILFSRFMLFGIKAKCINFSIRLDLLLSNRKRGFQWSKSSAQTVNLDILLSRVFSFLY